MLKCIHNLNYQNPELNVPKNLNYVFNGGIDQALFYISLFKEFKVSENYPMRDKYEQRFTTMINNFLQKANTINHISENVFEIISEIIEYITTNHCLTPILEIVLWFRILQCFSNYSINTEYFLESFNYDRGSKTYIKDEYKQFNYLKKYKSINEAIEARNKGDINLDEYLTLKNILSFEQPDVPSLKDFLENNIYEDSDFELYDEDVNYNIPVENRKYALVYPLITDSGFYGFNTSVLSYFNFIQPIGIPLKFSSTRQFTSIHRFIDHDFAHNHIMNMKYMDMCDIYYEIMISVKDPEILKMFILCIFWAFHELYNTSYLCNEESFGVFEKMAIFKKYDKELRLIQKFEDNYNEIDILKQDKKRRKYLVNSYIYLYKVIEDDSLTKADIEKVINEYKNVDDPKKLAKEKYDNLNFTENENIELTVIYYILSGRLSGILYEYSRFKKFSIDDGNNNRLEKAIAEIVINNEDLKYEKHQKSINKHKNISCSYYSFCYWYICNLYPNCIPYFKKFIPGLLEYKKLKFERK